MSYASKSYYEEEEALFREAYDFKVNDADVSLIVKKICRHFKSPTPSIKLRGNRQGGEACEKTNRIKLSHKPSMGLIIHETAHIIRYNGVLKEIFKNVSNKGTNHHGTIFQATIVRIHEWAKKNNYWRNQIEKRRNKRLISFKNVLS